MTARDWARYGQFLLNNGSFEGKEIVREELIRECSRPCAANPGYGLTFWLNAPGGYGAARRQRAGPGAQAGWIYPDGHPDIYVAAGSGRNLLIMIPARKTVVVRHGESQQFRPSVFLGLLLEGTGPERPSTETRNATPSDSLNSTLEG
jgi:CubicO group peptidase (beta-lactamase class C family)